jgi:hypothetical protein
MSIDLCCYSTLGAAETNALISEIKNEFPDLFRKNFSMTVAENADYEVYKGLRDLLAEHSFEATSKFLVKLDVKSAAAEVPRAASVLKSKFPPGQLLVLHTNEVRM